MESVRTGENWRESWWVRNTTSQTIAIGDLHLLPSLAPGQQVDLLRFYTRERISHARTLMALLKTGKLQLIKQKDYDNGLPGAVPLSEVEESVTPAEENELGAIGGDGHTHDNKDVLDGSSIK